MNDILPQGSPYLTSYEEPKSESSDLSGMLSQMHLTSGPGISTFQSSSTSPAALSAAYRKKFVGTTDYYASPLDQALHHSTIHSQSSSNEVKSHHECDKFRVRPTIQIPPSDPLPSDPSSTSLGLPSSFPPTPNTPPYTVSEPEIPSSLFGETVAIQVHMDEAFGVDPREISDLFEVDDVNDEGAAPRTFNYYHQSNNEGSRGRRTSRTLGFKCPVKGCGADFIAKHNLQNHLNARDCVKKYVCGFCQRKYTTSHVLNRHKRTCKEATRKVQ